MVQMTCVIDCRAGLGEGTCWDSQAQCLWWLDIFNRRIHRYYPANGRTETFATPEAPGCLAVREKGGLVIALANGFHFFDPHTELFDPIGDPEADIAATRFNDGKTDRQGRFWASTMFDPPGPNAPKIGGLYRLGFDHTCHRFIHNLGIPNGLAWSPDSRKMFFTDSVSSRISVWDFDPHNGEIENERTFADLNFIQGVGDGATVDIDGCYWITVPFKGKVLRFDPQGQLMQTFELPTDVPTCCEFGGSDLDILYVTTATLNRSPQQLEGQRQPGGLWAIDVGVKGLPASPFLG